MTAPVMARGVGRVLLADRPMLLIDEPTKGLSPTFVSEVVDVLQLAAATELLLIRPLYGNPVGQILVTIGLDLALVGLLLGGFGSDARSIAGPGWLAGGGHHHGA